jgi:hypothetical protein
MRVNGNGSTGGEESAMGMFGKMVIANSGTCRASSSRRPLRARE